MFIQPRHFTSSVIRLRARCQHTSTPGAKHRSETAQKTFLWSNIQYVEESTDPRHALDICINQNPFPRANQPVCVYVHGGSWQLHGNVDNTIKILEYCAYQGYVAVGVKYRLSPQVQHPEHVYDLCYALSWITLNIHNYGGDINQLALLGQSSGAHTVFYLLSHFYQSLARCQSSAISTEVPKPVGAVGISGPYDIVRLAQASNLWSPMVVGPVFGNSSERWREASPNYAFTDDDDDQDNLLHEIPIHLFYGSSDFHFEKDAQALAEKVTRGGKNPYPVQCECIPDTNHWTIISSLLSSTESKEDEPTIERDTYLSKALSRIFDIN